MNAKLNDKLHCKLIVSDFDNTLANSNNEVAADVVDAINGYVADGGIFAVCTGRILPSILPRVREIGLKGLVIASQGSTVADIESGKIIRSVHFTREQTALICDTFEELGLNMQVYWDGGFLSSLPEDEPHLNRYENIIRVKAEHTEEKLSALVRHDERNFGKVLTMCHPHEQEELFEKICARLGDRFDVTCSAKSLIEVSPMGETKGSALKFLCAHYGVPVESSCAVGDNLNDVSMIEAAGVGVAVGNSVQGLKDRADYVTVTNDEGAVKAVIERFGYGKC